MRPPFWLKSLLMPHSLVFRSQSFLVNNFIAKIKTKLSYNISSGCYGVCLKFQCLFSLIYIRHLNYTNPSLAYTEMNQTKHGFSPMFAFICIFSSPEPKAPSWAISIPMTPASGVRPSVVRPSIRPSVNIFKHLLLRNHWANWTQISYGDSLGWGNESLFKWSWSHDRDGRHAHIW